MGSRERFSLPSGTPVYFQRLLLLSVPQAREQFDQCDRVEGGTLRRSSRAAKVAARQTGGPRGRRNRSEGVNLRHRTRTITFFRLGNRRASRSQSHSHTVDGTVSQLVHIVPMKRAVAALDRVGSIGALVAAIAAPCCFPLFAAVGTALGLGALGRYESAVLYLFQAFAVVSLLGLAFAFREHRHPGPLLVGLASVGALAYTFYGSFSLVTLYTGLFGLLAATAWNYFRSRRRRSATPILRSVITCPQCGHRAEETMPTNCLSFLLRLSRVPRAAETWGWRLLCVLQLWLSSMPADSNRCTMLRVNSARPIR